jgi:integrase
MVSMNVEAKHDDSKRGRRRVKLTKTEVERLKPDGDAKQTIYWDTELRSFGICVGVTAKTYIVYRTVGSRQQGNRRNIKLTIGRHGVYMPDEARKRARELLAEFAEGKDPRESRRIVAAQQMTLDEAWKMFRRARPLKPLTLNDYTRAVERYLKDWLSRPLASISGQDVIEMFTRLSQDPGLGESIATHTLRTFRAVYNFAAVANDSLPRNPADRLTKLKLWRRDRRRTTYIQPYQLSAWCAAVAALKNENARDYLRLILFTGMRRSEAMSLRWDRIDFGRRTLTVPRTKNGEPLVLPLNRPVFTLLSDRRKRHPNDEFVFPGDAAQGHLREPKKWIAEVAKASGVPVTLHDLRRTFATVGEAVNVGHTTIKRLLNHRPGRDVTENHYIGLGIEQLRGPAERIASYIERASRRDSKTSQDGARVLQFTAGADIG